MDETSAPAAEPVAHAVDALVAELEREHAWLADLKADLARVEQRCGHLLNAADSALSALDRAERREYVLRLKRLQIDNTRLGRPPKDRRRAAILSLLAERGQGRVTNAELRADLKRQGLNGTSAYVGATLHRLASDGMLHKTGYGEYAIAHDHPKLRALRFREHREELMAEMRAERAARPHRHADPEIAQKYAEFREEVDKFNELAARPRGSFPEPEEQDAEEDRLPRPRQNDENGLYDPEW